ncbi:MAG: hypothetical protein WA655_14595 [Candidatus Korobacteraceae bacterium]
MTPQSNFMVLAPIMPGRVGDLRQLLATMNRSPGVVDPQNSLIPFGKFATLHFARLVVLQDLTLDDITAYGLPPGNYPIYLAFLGDFDGSPETFLVDLMQKAGDGLKRIFAYCEGFTPDADLLTWIKAHSSTPATAYVNWIGRTVQQVGEEAALHDALVSYVQQNAAVLAGMQPAQVHDTLQRYKRSEQQAGRLTLTPPALTPLGWQIRNLINLLGVPLVLLLLFPFLLIYSPFFFILLRWHEKSDPQIAPRIDPAHAHQLAILEDHDVTNQFTALGTLKPGRFRRSTLVFLLWVIDYTTKHIYGRGRLARVSTIHFARWVFLDGKKRLIFCSNYDGSLESYMDDFINKVGFGLNVVFGNGIGYPSTRWLLLDGAKDEQKFKYVLRRHELATEVWYNAHPGLTALDRHRNTQIREGLEKPSLSDSDARQWLQLI